MNRETRRFFSRFFQNPLTSIALFLFLFLFLLSFFVPWLSPYDISVPHLEKRFLPPSLEHPFGTDALGRDMFTKTFAGLRITLLVGLFATGVSLIIGVLYGALAGYVGGVLEEIMMRFVDVLYGLPYLAYVILVIFVFRQYGEWFFSRENLYLWEIFLMALAMGSISWLTIARIVRAEVLRLSRLEFVESARAIGASHARILFYHILPHLLGPVVVYATLTAPQVMLFESFISFLGLGLKPPHPRLGRIISDDGLARMAATNLNWWLPFFPGVVLALVLFSLNVLGDSLRDALDVKKGTSYGE